MLHFFPAAFTAGCSAEAHEFAEAIDQFAAASDEKKLVLESCDAAVAMLPDRANRGRV